MKFCNFMSFKTRILNYSRNHFKWFFFNLFVCCMCGEKPNEPHSLQCHMRNAFSQIYNPNVYTLSEMYTIDIFWTLVTVMVKSVPYIYIVLPTFCS